MKSQHNVIFAMEEPELALPPHTQRRVIRFVLGQMGQSIVTSHSPYIIEQFDPSQIVVLNRTDNGRLTGRPIDLHGLKPKVFARERRQFAEAVLARAVLVVEGATEAAVFSAASTVMETCLGAAYNHFDIAGVSIFDAGGDGSVPNYGPFFKGLGKSAFCFMDKPKTPLPSESNEKLNNFTKAWVSPDLGIEALLAKELPCSVLRSFLQQVKDRPDYPSQVGKVTDELSDEEVADLARRILEARKGNLYGYAVMVIGECSTLDDLPPTIRSVLEEINKTLNPPQSPQLVENPQESATAKVGSGVIDAL